ncbi:radical SAM protein [Geobacter sp. OR-1]|uniref:radical SAM protein n=1 Tax=Geobacter sp. OR-1 TaxID=1266765 RepID=UPI001364E0C1|nr:radical SAM protein [Geobacter sp. OR-1]
MNFRAIETANLPDIALPGDYNYIAAFLTLDCNLGCSYCINRFGTLASPGRMLSGAEWITGLNRLAGTPDLPITLQGGEPTLHPDFAAIISGLRSDRHIDILTNLETDLDRFTAEIDPARVKRDAPYASIRVSYHPESMRIEQLAAKVLRLLDSGYSVGIWGVMHPFWKEEIERARDYCIESGIDFRLKDFLGHHEGAMHGVLSYADACDRLTASEVSCRTTELIIGPDGGLYRCHADLYEGREPVGTILDPAFSLTRDFRPCSNYGFCNPCDVKLKTNRFQEFGHTSVEIIRNG